MPFACAHRAKGPRGSPQCASIEPPPAPDFSGCPDRAGVEPAGAHRSIAAQGGVNLAVAVRAPAADLAVRCQGAAMTPAGTYRTEVARAESRLGKEVPVANTGQRGLPKGGCLAELGGIPPPAEQFARLAHRTRPPAGTDRAEATRRWIGPPIRIAGPPARDLACLPYRAGDEVAHAHGDVHRPTVRERELFLGVAHGAGLRSTVSGRRLLLRVTHGGATRATVRGESLLPCIVSEGDEQDRDHDRH